jgi:membrane protease subunit (stomatin/prohibitin family)
MPTACSAKRFASCFHRILFLPHPEIPVSFREFIAGELIDIIEWLDESGDTMVWRFERPHNEIKNGAQLIVRPGQTALFVDQGRIADEFMPGRHRLTTDNLPVLSTLRGWKYGFASPFRAEVLFVATTQFANQKWGTSNPVIVRDPALGPVRLRAFGTYAVRVQNPETLVRELAGTDSRFTVDQISDQLRDLVVASVSSALADTQISILDLASRYSDLGGHVLARVAPQFEQYGLELAQLVVENVSLPAEVERAIDQHAKLSVIGDLDQYTRLQSADALRDAARNPSGAAGAGVGIGMGAAMAQNAMAPKAAPPAAPAAANEPPPIPRDAWYYVVAGERRGPTDLAGIRRAAASGEVAADTMVWKSGMADWSPLSKVSELARAIGAQ